MKRNLLLFFCLLISFQVWSQDNTVKKSPINGTWIEEIHQEDTLVFYPEYDGREPVFYLKRGRKNNIPKTHSGPYNFKPSKDSISIHWFLSSNIAYQTYFLAFTPDSNRLIMGNFFNDSLPNNYTLTFIKREETTNF